MLDIAVAAATRDRLCFLATNIEVLVSSGDGKDGTCIIEHRLPYDDSPPLHVHRKEDEAFVILSGRVRFRVGEDEFELDAGGAALAPQGIPHSYRVVSAEGARMLTVTRGGDFETLVRTVGIPTTSEELPAPIEVTPEMAAKLGAVCAANGIDLVGPPLS